MDHNGQNHIRNIISIMPVKICTNLFFIIAICPRLGKSIINEFTECHDDFLLKPADGIVKEHSFSWLGFVQYIHTTTGLPHHSKAPRVVLIHKQFGLGTAADLLRLPKNYKLGNVVFGDYERDEEDCALTKSQVKMGITCGHAYIEMPLSDIIPHPEFTRFGVGNSLALIKFIRPMRSYYMVPVCFPSIIEREKARKKKVVLLIDYISSVPRDFDSEKMAKKTLKLFTHRDCRRHRMRSRLGSEGVTHVLCTTGCGVRGGAPIIVHTQVGTFELIGIAAGGAPCNRRVMRNRLNSQPPLFIDIYPYNTWIVNVITAHLMPNAYPQRVMLTDAGGGPDKYVRESTFLRQFKRQKEGWRARTYVIGNLCFARMSKQRRTAMFYDEKFEVNADPPAKLNIFMRIIATLGTTIMCVRLNLPNRVITPVVKGVGGYNISLEMSTEWFPYTYYFGISLQGKNTSIDQYESWYYERQYAKYGTQG